MAGSQQQESEGRARGPITPRIVEQVRELHDAVVELSHHSGGLTSRQLRRQLKEARQSEADMLRVLGFASYEAFLEVAGEVVVTTNDTRPDVVVLDDATSDGPVIEANEAIDVQRELQRVVEDMTKTRRSTAGAVSGSARSDELDRFRARVGAFEEELAEVRFELTRMREELLGMRQRLAAADGPRRPTAAVASPDAAAGDHAPMRLEATFTDLAVSLAATAAELTNLFGQLQRERAELTAISEHARREAEQVLRVALDDAARARADAAVRAGEILDEARAEASALTRDARVTLEGLRRLNDADAGDASV